MAWVNNCGCNAEYVIAIPWGVVDQYSTQNRFCGWHNWTSAGSAGSWVTYTSLPYGPYLDYLNRGCGGKKVNGANGILDGVTIPTLHEYAETVNDPGLNGWLDADNFENGDKCSWINLANKTLSNGYTFPVQPTWSNTWQTQYGYGCYDSAPQERHEGPRSARRASEIPASGLEELRRMTELRRPLSPYSSPRGRPSSRPEGITAVLN